jgi:hypothetical protein
MLGTISDSAVRIPGTQQRIGFDPLLGLIPWAGDAISGMISAYLVWEAHRLGLPPRKLAQMAGNATIDLAFGAIPVLGRVDGFGDDEAESERNE